MKAITGTESRGGTSEKDFASPSPIYSPSSAKEGDKGDRAPEDRYFMGIDIGSEASKGVIIRNDEILTYHVLASGINYRVAVEKLREALLAKAKLSPEDIAGTVSTGRGSANVLFSHREATDIRCCARRISHLFSSVRTIIDVQAQATRVIKLNESGQVTNFLVSEKCAAGSARFLSVIANVLQVNLEDIGELSLKSKNPVTFTTSCAVFGESEAISRVAEGIPKEDILAGVHQALASKIYSLINRIDMEEDCVISGGGALDIGLVKSVEQKLGIKLLVPPQPQIVTALGAAMTAKDLAKAR